MLDRGHASSRTERGHEQGHEGAADEGGACGEVAGGHEARLWTPSRLSVVTPHTRAHSASVSIEGFKSPFSTRYTVLAVTLIALANALALV